MSAIFGDDPRPILILGPPGIGKSALTRQALHDREVIARFGDRRWFVRLDAAGDERALWTTILAQLGSDTPGADPAAQVLARLGDGDSLLVLDNLEAPWNADEAPVEEAVARLADVNSVRIVASVRGTAWPGRVDWWRPPSLEPLPADQARELFLWVAGEGYTDDPDLEAMVAALDGLPLAIELLARQAQGSRTLRGLRADFQERKGKLFELGDTKELSLKASLQLSLDSPKMTGAAKRLFTTMGRLPAGAAQEDLNKLISGGGHKAGRVLSQLGLAFEEGGRLRMLASIREQAALRPMRDVNTILRHYLGLAKTEGGKIGKAGGAEAAARLTPEISNLESTVDLAIREGKPKWALAAFDGLARFSVFTGAGSARPLERLLAAVQQSLDPHATGNCLVGLGNIAGHRSNYDAAREYFKRAMPLWQTIGRVEGEARCIQGLGDIAMRLSDHDAARDYFDRAMPLYRRAGDGRGEAMCIRSFGDIALRRSDHDAAREHYSHAIVLFREAGDVQGEGNCFLGFGSIALDCSDHDAARNHYDRAMELYRKVGDVLGEANCIRALGETALCRNDHNAAKEHFNRAMRLYRNVGDVRGEASCECGYGETARELRQNAVAETHYATSLTLFRQVHDPLGEARCLLGQGQLERAVGHAGAEVRLRQAFSLFDAIHFLEGCGRALLELAELAESAESKRELLLDAFDSHTRFGNPRWIGEGHRRLARISEGEEQQHHVAATREAWTSIKRPDLVAELDAEFDRS